MSIDSVPAFREGIPTRGSLAFTGDGGTLCRAIKIPDYSFTHLRELPEIYKMENNLYIVLHHADMDLKVLNRHVYEKCIVKCAVAKRDALNHNEETGLNSRKVVLSQSTASNPADSQKAYESQQLYMIEDNDVSVQTETKETERDTNK